YSIQYLELSYEATIIGKKTSGASLCTQESPRAKSGWRRYDWLKLGIIPVGSSLRDFTEKGITFCIGGILMQGLRHWKPNFWGFNLGTHRPFFDLGSHLSPMHLADRPTRIAGRPFIVPTGHLFGR
ncbi:hypothetical protein PJM48_28840, partial [Mycobacterium kansasii]